MIASPTTNLLNMSTPSKMTSVVCVKLSDVVIQNNIFIIPGTLRGTYQLNFG